ncbi:MAG: cell division protein FtsL [Anaerolineaceae bacterium]|nr:cell division protein FtsL [Anaerolineaceae bacterium]MCB9102161.1 cell division protein FtsL [Anaerolineales bacterium]
MSSNTMISLRPANVIRQIPWRLGSKTALGFILIIAIFSLVGWLYLTNASTVTATSYRIDELRFELDQLRNQNAALILEIAKLEALDRVEARATELGYRPIADVQYISVDNYPASSEPVESNYQVVYVENSVDAYIDDVAQPGWWQIKLDALVAWFEGRDVELLTR